MRDGHGPLTWSAQPDIPRAMRFLVATSAWLMAWLSGLAADAPAKFPAGGMTFTRPATWTWVETTSPMRKAQLGVPGIDGKSGGEVVFFHFGAGGGVEPRPMSTGGWGSSREGRCPQVKG